MKNLFIFIIALILLLIFLNSPTLYRIYYFLIINCLDWVNNLIIIFFFLQYGDLYNLNQQAFEKALDKAGIVEEEEEDIEEKEQNVSILFFILFVFKICKSSFFFLQINNYSNNTDNLYNIILSQLTLL